MRPSESATRAAKHSIVASMAETGVTDSGTVIMMTLAATTGDTPPVVADRDIRTSVVGAN